MRIKGFNGHGIRVVGVGIASLALAGVATVAFASPAWNTAGSPVKTCLTSAGSATYTTRPKNGKCELNTSP